MLSVETTDLWTGASVEDGKIAAVLHLHGAMYYCHTKAPRWFFDQLQEKRDERIGVLEMLVWE